MSDFGWTERTRALNSMGSASNASISQPYDTDSSAETARARHFIRAARPQHTASRVDVSTLAHHLKIAEKQVELTPPKVTNFAIAYISSPLSGAPWSIGALGELMMAQALGRTAELTSAYAYS